MIFLINELDIKAETTPLTVAERAAKREADDCLAKLRRDEESKWTKRAKVKYIQESGSNTRYFHIIANGNIGTRKYFNLSMMKEQ